MSLLLMWSSPLILLIVVFWICFLGVWVFLSGFVRHILAIMLTFDSGLSLLVVLLWPCTFFGALVWNLSLASGLSCIADNLKCVSGSLAALLSAARFTNMKIRLLGQEAAPKKCVFLVLLRKLGVI